MAVEDSYKKTTTSQLTIPNPLQPILQQYQRVFQESKSLPPIRSHNHKIPLKPHIDPINIRSYRHNYQQKNEVERQIQEMLAIGIIRPSNSPFSLPVLLVKKKDGSWRFCIDFRQLNVAMIKDKFSIPLVKDLLDELQVAVIVLKLDLLAGYHHILMHSDDVHKMAFKTHMGHYEFLVMPFDLINATATFQSLMSNIFQPYFNRFVLVFFDDILVYNPSMETHIDHLQIVLQILSNHFLYAKWSKYEFG